MPRPSDFWTPEREQILRDFYPTSTASELCARFGWNVKSTRVNTRAHVLGVKKAQDSGMAVTQVQQFPGYRIVTRRVMGF